MVCDPSPASCNSVERRLTQRGVFLQLSFCRFPPVAALAPKHFISLPSIDGQVSGSQHMKFKFDAPHPSAVTHHPSPLGATTPRGWQCHLGILHSKQRRQHVLLLLFLLCGDFLPPRTPKRPTGRGRAQAGEGARAVAEAGGWGRWGAYKCDIISL